MSGRQTIHSLLDTDGTGASTSKPAPCAGRVCAEARKYDRSRRRAKPLEHTALTCSPPRACRTRSRQRAGKPADALQHGLFIYLRMTCHDGHRFLRRRVLLRSHFAVSIPATPHVRGGMFPIRCMVVTGYPSRYPGSSKDSAGSRPELSRNVLN